MKLTKWYSGDQKPVRVGVYERKVTDDGIGYSYWNGDYWGVWGKSKVGVIQWRRYKSQWQFLPWRGIAK